MVKKCITMFCVAFVLCGCQKKYPTKNLITTALSLKMEQERWVRLGRPIVTNMSDWLGPTNVFCVYTNKITITNHVFHCLFAARRLDWPSGVMAVTEEGVIVWIRDRDGNVTIDPQKHGVEP
jgi:hypothetical protein